MLYVQAIRKRNTVRNGMNRAAAALCAAIIICLLACSQEAIKLPEEVPDDFSIEYSFSTEKVRAEANLTPVVEPDGEVWFEISGLKERKGEKRGLFGPTDFEVKVSRTDCRRLYKLVREQFFSLNDSYEGFGDTGYGTSTITITADGNVKTVEVKEISVKPVSKIVMEMNRLIKSKKTGFSLEAYGM